ncbi:MAG: HAMP domain-containing histidine kinase [Lachnospiraceae bacterium]|nr:HAMP domain-containing histidine kinase [Lachnospiraceae bacterium]
MKELRKKTILTIFAILTVMLITGLTLLNVNSYRREYMSIERGLNVFDDRGGFRDGPRGPEGGVDDRKLKPRELDNMMFMDNEVYTVRLDETGGIAEILSHGSISDDFDVETIAAAITDSVSGTPEDRMHIGNLYRDAYSYKYRSSDLIVILNNDAATSKLKTLLLQSVILFLVTEALTFLAARLIAGWIAKPAEEAFARQKEFIADASHELKTPLAVIMASADELSDNAAPEKKDRYIENIRYESDRMSRLIAGLLDLSKLEDDRSKDAYKDEDLTRIIEKTCLTFDGVAYEQGVTIETDIEEGLVLKCGRDEMEKMISTILDNAVKHSFRDTTVRVSAHSEKGSILIRIVNTGEPIKEEDREKIFERFYRADRSRNRDDNRYGLGLAIARRIARNHNGDIRAYSGEGDTTFEITLK